ncbi:ribonuclease H, partial [Tanacetum coccineum]
RKKVDSSKALDASLVIIESNVTESQEQDTSSRSRNDAHVDDADIRPIDDEDSMAEVQMTAEINVFAIGQRHTEQPELNNKGEVDQNAEQCHDTCLLPAKLTDNQTTELSNQSLKFENIRLKKTVAQFQKDFLRMEAHCVNLELKYQMENNVLKSGQQSQFFKEKSNEAKVKNDIDVTETINIELEHSVAKLLAKNELLHKEKEHLKQTYKDLFDYIKTTRVQTKNQNDSLMVQLNKKSNENANVLAQIQKKGFVIASLKNELRKLTGNSVNTKFAKPLILGKPVLQPHKNQSVVRQPNAFKSERPKISKPRSDLAPQRQEMSVENVSSGLAKYALEILKKHNMDNCDSVGTPLATKPKLDVDLSGEPVDQSDYRTLPTKKSTQGMKRIFKYLKGTINMRLCTSGGIQFLGDKLVSWMSKKQNCTAMSSAEAEYVVLSASCAQIIMENVIPPDLVDDLPVVEPNQPDDVPVIPEPVLVDEDEDPEEEEFKEEEEPQEEDDMEVDIEEDKNELDLAYPYEEVDPLNPPPPASDSEPEDVIKVEDTVESKDETVPASVHEVDDFSFKMIMWSRDGACIGQKEKKEKDEYYGKLILDLGNEVRSSVEEGTAVMENLVRKLGNAEERAECKKLKKELE